MQNLSLFENKFIANTLYNIYRCPKCRNDFSVKFFRVEDRNGCSRRPFLLPCGHDMCETCIGENIGQLSCAVCLRPIPLALLKKSVNDHNVVRKYFPLNSYLIGELNNVNYFYPNRQISNGKKSGQLNLSMKTITGLIFCEECHSKEDGLCKQCGMHFCWRCFNEIHSKNSFRNHELIVPPITLYKAYQEMQKGPQRCPQHKKNLDNFCLSCDLKICVICKDAAHIEHDTKRISIMNKESKPVMEDIVKKIQDAKQHIQDAQKKITSTAKQFSEYADRTTEDIAKHFLELHSMLQIEQRNLMRELAERCEKPQKEILDVEEKLNETYSKLDKYLKDICYYKSYAYNQAPLFSDVATFYEKLIDGEEFEIETTKVFENPFIWKQKHQLGKYINNCYNIQYKDPGRLIIYTKENDQLFYQQAAQESLSNFDSKMDISMDSYVAEGIPKHVKKKVGNISKALNKKIMKNDTSFMEVDNMSSVIYSRESIEDLDSLKRNAKESLAQISYVNNWGEFYIQKLSSLEMISSMSKKSYKAANDISEGILYMIKRPDGIYSRGMITNMSEKKVTAFLVDVGTEIEVPHNRVFLMDKESGKAKYAAFKCVFHGIAPTTKRFHNLKTLLFEIIANQPVHFCPKVKENGVFHVDLLTTHTPTPISVRDILIYIGAAEETTKIYREKKMYSTAPRSMCFDKSQFESSEIISVHATHVVNPHEFYVIQVDACTPKEDLMNQLNHYYDTYGKEIQHIFFPFMKMCCAVKYNKVWYRASIEKVLGEGFVEVHLVDEGNQVKIYWRDIYKLESQFCHQKEFAIKCCLAHVECLQRNDYDWTSQALRDFKIMLANPILEITFISSNKENNNVLLTIIKEHAYINAGSALAKHGHAMYKGDIERNTEIFKRVKEFNKENNNESINNDTISSSRRRIVKEESGKNIDKRTEVGVVHIVSPGEFFLYLKKLEMGTIKFHEQIQRVHQCLLKPIEEKRMELENASNNWNEGDHCIAYISCKNFAARVLNSNSNNYRLDAPEIKSGNTECEWYRGVIVSQSQEDDDNATYSIFLRDIGETISGINPLQLYSISHEWDYVTNAVRRCHLASIQPTNGTSNWTSTAIDSFKYTCNSHDTLYASLKGNPNAVSLPMSLWGASTETTDALGPSKLNYVNINRMLVNAGIAHSTQTTQISEEIEELQFNVAENEISIKQWYDNFLKNPFEKVFDKIKEKNSRQGVFDNSEFLTLKLTESDKIPTKTVPPAWLTAKSKVKILFTAYPTYVDYDGDIYMHDGEDHELLQEMNSIISSEFNGKYNEPNREIETYSLNQPCIVKYHLDKLLYRGIVTNNNSAQSGNKDEYQVFFIDYGNTEGTSAENLLPYAPFPMIKAFAQKFVVKGIQPKDGEEKYSIDVLDVLHFAIVGELVSVRLIPTSSLPDSPKICNIRFKGGDFAKYLIKEGFVDNSSPESIEAFQPKSIFTRPMNPVEWPAENNETDEESYCSAKSKKEMEYDFFTNLPYEHFLNKEEETGEEFNALDEAMFRSSSSDNDDASNCDLEDNELKVVYNNTNLYPPSKCQEFKDSTTQQPPTKKRMFDVDDYNRLRNLSMEEIIGVHCNDKIIIHKKKNKKTSKDNMELFKKPLAKSADGDDPDLADLEQSFAFSGWLDHEDETKPRQHKTQSKANTEEYQVQMMELSVFDKFTPMDNYSEFSQISGFDAFRPFHLPLGVRNFHCEVFHISTPTIIYINPLLTEFSYRDIELKRFIKDSISTAKPLTTFAAGTPCLACFSKDKQWYRAILLSYNPKAKQADVIYADYLNKETLSIDQLKECTPELTQWALRTIRVRLHNLQPNPSKRVHDLRIALGKVVAGRKLFARIMKDPEEIVLPGPIGEVHKNHNVKSDAGLMEICLYLNEESEVSVFEKLIKKNFYYDIGI